MNEKINKGEDYDLDARIYWLLRDEPYFAGVSRALHKRVNRSMDTAGVRYNKDRRQFELQYNPEFMARLSDEHQRWVIKHELYHCSLDHCTDRKLEDVTNGDHKIANCAMDLAINSLPGMAETAPDFVLLPGRAPFEKVTVYGCAAEWYAKKIMDGREKQPENQPGQGQPGQGQSGQGQPGQGQSGQGQDASPDSFDDHSDFGAGNGDEEDRTDREVAAGRLKDAISKAARECDVGGDDGSPAQGWGSVSSRVRGEILKACRGQVKLTPEQIFRQFCQASVAANKKTSVTKRSRRLPGKKFGRRVEHRANIAISVDMSGSVSDHLLGLAFELMNKMSEKISFTVIPFDHKVFDEKVFVWKKGETRKRERVLYGGTNFDAPTNWVNKRRFDGHVVITDMLAPKPVKSGCTRLWVTDKWGSRCPVFKPQGERVLVLT
jgi:predicted metal-dependent peptidase